jgi:high-affinity iron transporter
LRSQLTTRRYGSVIGYNVYWIVVILGFVLLRWREKKGTLPFQKKRDIETPALPRKESDTDSSSSPGEITEKQVAGPKGTQVSEIKA